MVAFANADGGKIVIGISDKNRRIEGVDYEIERVNELLRVPFDFCEPTVKVDIERVPCIDYKGRENHVIVMHLNQVRRYMRISQMKYIFAWEISQSF